MTKVKINSEWLDYDYSVIGSDKTVSYWIYDLQSQEHTPEYLGKSSIIKSNGKEIDLKCNFLFFKLL